MKQEHSAGMIVYRLVNKKRHYLLLQYSYKKKFWDFVKGNIEKGETEQKTSIRELKEETGITEFKIIPGFKEKINWFYRTNELIYKDVIFFLAKTNQKEIKLTEHIDYAWLPYTKAIKKVTYKNAKDILKKAEDFLRIK
ncbi:NUDIX domain-containing protein [Candidatus Woesearchaeota archaeon]|nr:NUDIX domain-containing protein [Candidatus Woesearchaeota archaeon]